MNIIIFITGGFGWFILADFQNKIQGNDWKIPAYADTLKNPFANNEKAIANGSKIYASMCWTCHGNSGQGNGPAAKGLLTPPADHTSEKVQAQPDGVLFWKISKGNRQMDPYEKILSKKQRWELVAYIRTWRTSKTGK